MPVEVGAVVDCELVPVGTDVGTVLLIGNDVGTVLLVGKVIEEVTLEMGPVIDPIGPVVGCEAMLEMTLVTEPTGCDTMLEMTARHEADWAPYSRARAVLVRELAVLADLPAGADRRSAAPELDPMVHPADPAMRFWVRALRCRLHLWSSLL